MDLYLSDGCVSGTETGHKPGFRHLLKVLVHCSGDTHVRQFCFLPCHFCARGHAYTHVGLLHHCRPI